MINHPERISMAHIADMVSGKQRHISDFVELDAGDVATSAKRVLHALKISGNRKIGGEKI